MPRTTIKKNKKKKNSRTLRKQQGGAEPISIITIMGISFIISLVTKMLAGTYNIYWARHFPNELVERNNKIIGQSYIHLINVKKMNIKILEECIEDRKNCLYRIIIDNTINNEKKNKIKTEIIKQINDYLYRLNLETMHLKKDELDYSKFIQKSMDRIDEINKRLKMTAENINLEKTIKNEGSKYFNFLRKTTKDDILINTLNRLDNLSNIEMEKMSEIMNLNIKSIKDEFMADVNSNENYDKYLKNIIIREYNDFSNMNIIDLVDYLNDNGINTFETKKVLNKEKNTKSHQILISKLFDKNYKNIKE